MKRREGWGALEPRGGPVKERKRGEGEKEDRAKDVLTEGGSVRETDLGGGCGGMTRADVRECLQGGMTALHNASQKGHVGAVELLLKAGGQQLACAQRQVSGGFW